MKTTIQLLALLLMLFLTANLTLAQPELLPTPDQAPIDGGLGLLAAAGGAYAVKKLKGKRAD